MLLHQRVVRHAFELADPELDEVGVGAYLEPQLARDVLGRVAGALERAGVDGGNSGARAREQLRHAHGLAPPPVR